MIVAGASFAGRLGRIPLDLNDTLTKISSVIVDWNLNKNYSETEANCQHFADELLKALGIPHLMDGALAEFLTRMRECGSCESEIVIPDEMKKEIHLKESKKIFTTHKELDEFVLKCLKRDPAFQNNFVCEWMLLKSIDRAFWVRHFKEMSNKKYKPSDKCPFGDPSIAIIHANGTQGLISPTLVGSPKMK